jgi:hypothetical protein
MSIVCYSTLKVYGNAAFSEPIREIIEAVFGPCLHDHDHPEPEAAAGSPVAVVRITSIEAPPTDLVGELSGKLPELTFALAYTIPSMGCRGSSTYKDGQVGDRGDESSESECTSQEFVEPAFDDCGYATSSAVTGEATCTQTPTKAYPKSLRERAQEYHDYNFDLQVNSIRGVRRPDNFEYVVIDVWRNHLVIRAMLSKEDRKHFDELDSEREALVESLRSQVIVGENLLGGLAQLEKPDVAKLLNADDRAALERLIKVCRQVGPECYEALIEKMPEVEPF